MRRCVELHHVGVKAAVGFPRIHHVEDETRRRAPPFDAVDAGVAPHDAYVRSTLRLPRERRHAGACAIDAAGERRHGKEHVMRGDHEVVDHARVGRVEAVEARHVARGVEAAERHAGAERVRRAVAEKEQFAGLRIELRMRGERPIQPVAEVDRAERRERVRVELDRPVGFLQRQQPAAVQQHICVGDAVVEARGVRRGRIEADREVATGGLLGLPAFRAHPAIAVTHFAARESEAVDHPVAREPVLGRIRKQRVRPVAHQRAVQFARQRARDR